MSCQVLCDRVGGTGQGMERTCPQVLVFANSSTAVVTVASGAQVLNTLPYSKHHPPAHCTAGASSCRKSQFCLKRRSLIILIWRPAASAGLSSTWRLGGGPGLWEPLIVIPPNSYSALIGPGGPRAGAGERAPADATHGLAGLGTVPLQH